MSSTSFFSYTSYDLDRFTEEPEDISAESDDEPDGEAGDESGEEPGDEPPAAPVAANSVGPGKEPLPATAQEFAAQVLNRKPD